MNPPQPQQVGVPAGRDDSGFAPVLHGALSLADEPGEGALAAELADDALCEVDAGNLSGHRPHATKDFVDVNQLNETTKFIGGIGY